MTSFTLSYEQPGEYRFSLDSVEAPLEIANALLGHQMPSELQVLDLCAGCGVMGLELAYHLPISMQLDFVEIQPVYEPYFKINFERLKESDLARGLKRNLGSRWLQMNYDLMMTNEFKARYDLVLANPPYFRPEQGLPSPSDFKNRSRFFLDSTSDQLWDVVSYVLRPGQTAYILIRDLQDHRLDLVAELKARLRYRAEVHVWKQIRGTHLVCVRLFA